MNLERVCTLALQLAEAIPSFITRQIRYEEWADGYQLRLSNSRTSVTFSDPDVTLQQALEFCQKAEQYNPVVTKGEEDEHDSPLAEQ